MSLFNERGFRALRINFIYEYWKLKEFVGGLVWLFVLFCRYRIFFGLCGYFFREVICFREVWLVLVLEGVDY